METNIIYNTDCYKYLKEMPNKSVDLVICDFPYKMNAGDRGGGFYPKRKYLQTIVEHKQDNFSIGFNPEILDMLKRILKKFHGYFFCNKEQLKMYLDFAYENKYFFDLLTWHKENPSPLNGNKYLSDTEYIMLIREKGTILYTKYDRAQKYFITTVKKSEFEHPTIKPLNIIRTLILNSSRAGDIILDPMIGTGTVAVGCIQTGRKYIGMEIDNKYFDIANQRISQANEEKNNNFFNKFKEQELI